MATMQVAVDEAERNTSRVCARRWLTIALSRRDRPGVADVDDRDAATAR